MKKTAVIIIFVIILVILFTAYSIFTKDENENNIINKKNLIGKMKIKSDFENNGNIPTKFTCDGENISPPLEISEIPAEAKTLAIISDDPDAPAGTWVHWVVWNIPVEGDIKTIAEGESPGTEGKTDFGSIGYGGPCPPSGTHRYFFKVYALDTELDLTKGATKAELEKAMEGHIIDKAELIGLYSRE